MNLPTVSTSDLTQEDADRTVESSGDRRRGVSGDRVCRVSGTCVSESYPAAAVAAIHSACGRHSRSLSTSSSTNRDGTGQENQRLISSSGATTAARTLATTSSASPPDPAGVAGYR